MSPDLPPSAVEEEEAPPVEEEERRPRLPPVAYPVLGLVFGAALVWAFSRILLLLHGTDLEVGGVTVAGTVLAAMVALFMALNLLIGAALVASGGRVRGRPAAMPLLWAAAIAVLAGGVAAATAGGEQGRAEGPPAQAVTLVAQGSRFDLDRITVPAGARVEITLDNRDAGVQHNVAVFAGADATGELVFRGDLVTGPGSTTYSFQAPPPGTYFFHCDVHPTQMTGTLEVTEGPEGPPPEGGGGELPPGAVDLGAQNTAFQPTQLRAVPRDGKVVIRFTNSDALPHNVAVFQGTDATGTVIFRGEILTGPGTMDYSFDAPPPGTYFFHCDVHPVQMTGQITIEEGSEPAGPG